MKFRLTYYGQADREVDLDPGDLFKFVAVDGRQGRGLALGIEIRERGFKEIPVLRWLGDRGVEETKVSMFFRIERLQTTGSL